MVAHMAYRQALHSRLCGGTAGSPLTDDYTIGLA